jgi:hypothetical protein
VVAAQELLRLTLRQIQVLLALVVAVVAQVNVTVDDQLIAVLVAQAEVA